MEAERVKEILSTLTITYAAVSVVRSAPAAGVFSRIQGSIVYENTPMHVPVLDLFDLQEDVLTDERPCCQRQLLTLRKQLISVLNDAEMASSLVTLLSEEPTERLQFLAIVNSFLQRLVSTASQCEDLLADHPLSAGCVSPEGISGDGYQVNLAWVP